MGPAERTRSAGSDRKSGENQRFYKWSRSGSRSLPRAGLLAACTAPSWVTGELADRDRVLEGAHAGVTSSMKRDHYTAPLPKRVMEA